MFVKSLSTLLVALMLTGAMGGVSAQAVRGGVCGELRGNHYGPYDYRKERSGKLAIVESAHFTPDVESLRKGKSSDYIGDDIRYTLDTSPNHHRALVAVTNLAARSKALQAPHTKYTVECYYERAVAFTPDDAIVRMLYAKYLYGLGRKEEMEYHMKLATRLAGDNPFTHYNLGLVYFESGMPEQALVQAHKAMSMGFARTELKDRLVALGKWSEPVVAPARPASSAQ